MKKYHLCLCLSACIFLTGCGIPITKGKILSQKSGADIPDLIAILPPENQSNDMTAVEVIQRAGGAMVTGRGYYALANKAQDEVLRKMGITDGGQLRAYKPSDICKNLGVQGLLYSTVENFNEINIGFWMSKKVKVNYTLVDQNGETLWQGESSFSMKNLTINPQAAAQAFVERKVGEVVEKIMKVHLVPESNMAAMKLSEKIIPWPNEKEAGKQ